VKGITKKQLRAFVKESNMIEGIKRAPTPEELYITREFLNLSTIFLTDVENYVKEVAGAPLRDKVGMNVTVGPHCPPPGGPTMRECARYAIDRFLNARGDLAVARAHVWYETLHPFMDGNGRSGRVLWAWAMYRDWGGEAFTRNFLHNWYYASLSLIRINSDDVDL